MCRLAVPIDQAFHSIENDNETIHRLTRRTSSLTLGGRTTRRQKTGRRRSIQSEDDFDAPHSGHTHKRQKVNSLSDEGMRMDNHESSEASEGLEDRESSDDHETLASSEDSDDHEQLNNPKETQEPESQHRNTLQTNNSSGAVAGSNAENPVSSTPASPPSDQPTVERPPSTEGSNAVNATSEKSADDLTDKGATRGSECGEPAANDLVTGQTCSGDIGTSDRLSPHQHKTRDLLTHLQGQSRPFRPSSMSPEHWTSPPRHCPDSNPDHELHNENDHINIEEHIDVGEHIDVDEQVDVDERQDVDGRIDVDECQPVDESLDIDDRLEVDGSIDVDEWIDVDERIDVHEQIDVDDHIDEHDGVDKDDLVDENDAVDEDDGVDKNDVVGKDHVVNKDHVVDKNLVVDEDPVVDQDDEIDIVDENDGDDLVEGDDLDDKDDDSTCGDESVSEVEDEDEETRREVTANRR
jgi:hypothetical protein